MESGVDTAVGGVRNAIAGCVDGRGAISTFSNRPLHFDTDCTTPPVRSPARVAGVGQPWGVFRSVDSNCTS